MAKEILVSILSDDLFALNWMSMLIVRDWRTRVFSEGDLSTPLNDTVTGSMRFVDVILADVDSFVNNTNLYSTLKQYLALNPSLMIMGVDSRLEPPFFQRIPIENIAGYLIKAEISSSLGWAVSFANDGYLVFTPSAKEATDKFGLQSAKCTRVVKSRTYPGMSDRQSEIARLAIIFSVSRRDLADELKISDQWSYGVVSELYEKLGLNELSQEKNLIIAYLENDLVIREHINDIIAELGTSKKAKDLETLAFHILTLPDIE